MVLGIGGCTALLLAGYGINDSISNLTNFQYEEITIYDVSALFTEELNELYEVHKSGDKEKVFYEMGELLFSVVNVSRKVGVEPEEALNRATEKFMRRFALLEKEAESMGVKLADMTAEEADILWERIKNHD